LLNRCKRSTRADSQTTEIEALPADEERCVSGPHPRFWIERIGELSTRSPRPPRIGHVFVLSDNTRAHDERKQKPGSAAMSRRVGGEAPVPAFQPVVSSPPPSEPVTWNST
jgi:hypothetical protein